MRTEAKIGSYAFAQPKNAKSCQKLDEAGRDPPPESLEGLLPC